MSDEVVPRTKSGSPVPGDHGELDPRTRPAGLGRQQLAYEVPDLASWSHWPSEVLTQLRTFGTAPARLDVGTAGWPTTKRRPSGIYYRERDGWYFGSDLASIHR